MLGTIAGAACAAFLLYGCWVVVRELLYRARGTADKALPDKELFITPQS